MSSWPSKNFRDYLVKTERNDSDRLSFFGRWYLPTWALVGIYLASIGASVAIGSATNRDWMSLSLIVALPAVLAVDTAFKIGRRRQLRVSSRGLAK